MDLILRTRKHDHRTVVEAWGDLDNYTAPKLRGCLRQLVADGQYHIILDLTNVGFLDSTGLGVLVRGLKQIRTHDGQLALVYENQQLNKTFHVTGLVKAFPIYTNINEALRHTEPIAL